MPLASKLNITSLMVATCLLAACSEEQTKEPGVAEVPVKAETKTAAKTDKPTKTEVVTATQDNTVDQKEGDLEEKPSQPKAEVNEARVTPDNPEAILSPAASLQPDTLEAANINRSDVKVPYVGVWASSADGCALIDQGVYDGFAVVTMNTVRTFEEICQIDAGPPQSNKITLDATCSAEGETYPGKLIFEMANGQNLNFKHEGTSGFSLLRCNLPR